MEYILIADAGSTKVEWTVLSRDDGTTVMRHISDGLNALMASEEDVEKALTAVRNSLGDYNRFSEIHYYGAGCATPRICTKMESCLRNVWDAGYVAVTSDLLGSARALFATDSGIACILGTGSNSCLYDGEKIVRNVPSLGFILGDEGSGAALGKRLISDAMKGVLPSLVKEKFLDTYQLTLQEILDKVYRSQAPNKFLASLVPFISDNLWNPYIYSLVLKELSSFVSRNVAMYSGAHSLPVSFTGSIAYAFEKILREAVSSQGLRVADIVKSPMDGLINYHKQHVFP